MSKKIKQLFAIDVNRRIEEVIKVDQTDQKILISEIDEYVATDSIRRYYTAILERYFETPNKPHEGIAVWVSGFFGSGKSSFAKMLGLMLENKDLGGESASSRCASSIGDSRIEVVLKNIGERIPTESVVFDLSTDRGIRSGNQMLTEIMYRELLERLGYARDLDLAELEITLEDEGRFDDFKKAYTDSFQKDWDSEKGKVAFALSQASRVMHELDSATYPSPDSWVKSIKGRTELSANRLADRSLELMERRHPGRNLVFVVDEVGQFVARDVQKMLDLQGIVQAIGRVGRGKMWVVVTSQERLSDVVRGIDDTRVEHARLMDRFPQELQVHLEQSDISEVTSKRVLSKNAEAEGLLRKLFDENRGRLIANTQLTADIALPELTGEGFIALYPLLPYQVDLIIQVVSGLRTQGGASKHVGGANRTIIKLAQQLLINPAVALGDEDVGKLATIEHIYDLVKSNIESEIRDKIERIATEVHHPRAQSVAKSICLLQFVKSIHRTAENIAASLHEAVDGDTLLPEVKEALDQLEKAHKVRKGESGYRIPTPAEDDWEKQRAGLSAKPADMNRIYGQVIEGLWQPQPSHNLMDTKLFKGGLHLNGRQRVQGDIAIQLYLAEEGEEFEERVKEARSRSQTEDKDVFWVVPLDHQIDRTTVEVFRSDEILTRKERGAQTRAELSLVSEEKRRLTSNRDELKRLMLRAALEGTAYFRGNDRSPGEGATDLGRTVSGLLGEALPRVFDQFDLAAARVQKKDVDVLTTSENLHGLTTVFSTLKLLKDEGGKPVFDLDSGPLKEVFSRIENHYSYGKAATGKTLADEFGKEPYGWEFEAVRLFVLCLLRAGKVDVISKGQTIESALSVEAKNVFGNNNLFRAASFRPKQVLGFDELVKAGDAFKNTFGRELPDIASQGAVADAIRKEVDRYEEAVREQETLLKTNLLPGIDVLSEALNQMRAIRTGTEENAILSFNGAHAEIKEAIKRGKELSDVLNEATFHTIKTARERLSQQWVFLSSEPDCQKSLRQEADNLKDLLQRETFFKELPKIDQHSNTIQQAYEKRLDEAAKARADTYTDAVKKLEATPGWEQIEADQQQRIAEPLASRAVVEAGKAISIPQLRSDTDACPKRLEDAVSLVLRAVEGGRLVQVNATSYFSDGVETEEQLDSALTGLREECAKHIGEGKKVFLK
ncbi:MAG: BREX system P-loop protein BrxC [Phycisphaerales bacterium]|nr:BREX system P-loop protein BrxC [Phycisphaerales bacterium]